MLVASFKASRYMYMQYGCSYQRLLYCTCRCTSTCTCTRTTCILNNLVGVHVQVHVHVHVMYKFTCTCTCMECTEFSKYTCKYYRMGGINQMQLQKYRYLSVLLDCTGTFLQLVRLPFDVYRPEFGKNCKVCCAIGKNLRVKLLFFFFFAVLFLGNRVYQRLSIYGLERIAIWLQLLIVYRISIGSMPFWVLRLNIRCTSTILQILLESKNR